MTKEISSSHHFSLSSFLVFVWYLHTFIWFSISSTIQKIILFTSFSKIYIKKSNFGSILRSCVFRAIELRRVLSRVPEEMTDRHAFLETIKLIASSIKKLLEAINNVYRVVPAHAQPGRSYSYAFSDILQEIRFKNCLVSHNIPLLTDQTEKNWIS